MTIPREWINSLPSYAHEGIDRQVLHMNISTYHVLCRSLGVEPIRHPDGAVACMFRFGEPIEWHDENGRVIR